MYLQRNIFVYNNLKRLFNNATLHCSIIIRIQTLALRCTNENSCSYIKIKWHCTLYAAQWTLLLRVVFNSFFLACMRQWTVSTICACLFIASSSSANQRLNNFIFALTSSAMLSRKVTKLKEGRRTSVRRVTPFPPPRT